MRLAAANTAAIDAAATAGACIQHADASAAARLWLRRLQAVRREAAHLHVGHLMLLAAACSPSATGCPHAAQPMARSACQQPPASHAWKRAAAATTAGAASRRCAVCGGGEGGRSAACLTHTAAEEVVAPRRTSDGKAPSPACTHPLPSASPQNSCPGMCSLIASQREQRRHMGGS
eukprot:357362-Chlamydomonas_euryale.AAC.7